VAYCKDQKVELTNVIKTAAMLCGDCKPVEVRQVLYDRIPLYIRASFVGCCQLHTSYSKCALFQLHYDVLQ